MRSAHRRAAGRVLGKGAVTARRYCHGATAEMSSREQPAQSLVMNCRVLFVDIQAAAPDGWCKRAKEFCLLELQVAPDWTAPAGGREAVGSRQKSLNAMNLTSSFLKMESRSFDID